MAIEVELFDGTILEFPEGTDPNVIDRAAKQETLARRPSEPEPTPEDQSIWRQVADVPVGIGLGAVRGVRGIIDTFGADNTVSKSLQGVEKYIDGLLSAQAKGNQQEIGRIMQEAEDKGVVDQLKAAVDAFTTAPVDLMSQALGTAAPNLLIGLKARLLGWGTRATTAAMGTTGAAMGAGIVKSEIYNAVKDELEESGVSPEEAERVALQAQSYGGDNLDQIALAALLGGASATLGIERAIVPGLTGKISQKLAKKGIGKFAQTVAGETLTEAAQGGQEQLATNLALQREGFDVPTMRGVVGQAALEGITGGGLGAGVSMLPGGGEKDPSAGKPPPTVTEERIQQLRAEQQTAEDMREIAREEAAEQQRQIIQNANDVADRVVGLDLRIDTLESTLDSLYAAKDDLTLLRGNLDPGASDAPVRGTISQKLKAINDKIKEGQALAKLVGVEPVRRAREAKDAVGNIPLERRAKTAATVFESVPTITKGFTGVYGTEYRGIADPAVAQGEFRTVGEPQIAETIETPVVDQKLTKQELMDVGLPQNAGYTRKLAGMDMADPAQRTQAAEIIGQAMVNPRVGDEVKQKLQTLYNQKIAAPAPEGQQTLDFESDPTPAAPAITQESFNAMGIGNSALIRRNTDLLNADLTDPAQLAFVRNALEAYRDAPERSEGIVNKVNAFLDTLPKVPETAPDVTPTDTQAPQDITPTDTQAPQAPAPKTVSLFRGVPQDRAATPTVGDGLFMSPERSVAQSYAGDSGTVAETEVTFNNLLETDKWTDAKKALGLPQNATMDTLVRTARDAGYDGLSFNTRNGKEFVVLNPETTVSPETTPTAPQPQEVTPDATTTQPSTSEPATQRPAGEPSVGVADVGDGSTAPQESTPGAVPAATEPRLDDTPTGTERDPSTVQQSEPTLDTELTIDNAVDQAETLAQQETPNIKEVARLARNAFSSGLLPELQYKAIAKSIAERDELAASDLYDALMSEQRGNNIVNAVRTARVMGDSAGAVTPALVQAIRSGNPQAALEAILNDDTAAFTPQEQLVARKILDMRMPLPTMRIVDSLGVDKNGDPILGEYNSITDEISLVRGTEDSHTLLHEVVHAFVHRTIIEQETSGARNPAFRDLQDVYNHVLKARPDLSEKYAMSSLTEFASEVMSNRDFQMQMMGIEYKQQSVFSWFARALRDLLGLSEDGPVGNVLFTSMVAVDGLMRTGRELQMGTKGMKFGEWNIASVVQNLDTPLGKPLPSTFAEIDAAPDPAYRSALRKFANTVAQSEVPLADIVRQQTVDQFATVARKISAAFSQGVRGAFGDVNPMVWIRQAYDNPRVALQMFRLGGIRMDKNGLWEAYELKDSNGKPVSPKKVIEIVQKLAEKQNMTYSQAKARVATLLESMRLKSLREHNAKLETLAREKAKAGDVDGAFETRQEKFPLHKTNAEIDADVAVFNSTPELSEIQSVMNAVRNNVIDAMVLSGRITEERGKAWKEIIDYVPFDRLQDVMVNPEVLRAPGRRGLAVLAKLPEFRGSFVRPVSNTIDNYMNRLAAMVGEIMKNSANVRTLEYMVDAGMARRLGNKDVAENQNFVLPPQYIKGREVRYEVQNQYDMAAFVDTPPIKSTFIDALGGASRLLRTTITATPMFAIKQVIDDSQRVIFNSGVKQPFMALARTLYNFPRIWWAQARGNDFSFMQRMEALGIAGDFDYNPINPLSTLEADTKAVARSPIRALIHTMEQGARASDMAARLAVYEQTMKESNDPLLAQQRARELINFNRRGSSKSMRAIVHVVPFFNSWAQGLDLMYRGMTGVDAPSGLEARKAQRMFLGRVAMMTAFATIYALSMSDDEYYKEQSDDVRDRNWLLPKAISDGLGMKQPLKISVPNEFGFLFKSIPERVAQYLRESQTGEQKEASSVFIDAVKAIGGEYLFMPIPAAFKPLIENTVNYSTFTGRPLVPDNLKRAPRPLQYTSATSELGKALGEATGQSPILIDNFIRGYFGMVGGAVSVVADGILNPARPDRGPEQLPFLSIGLLAPVGTRTRDEFYDFRNKVTEAVIGARLTAEREPDRYDAFVRKNGHLMEAAQYVNNYVKYLDRIRQARKEYETDPTMSGEAKREAILELRKMEQEVLSDFRELRAEAMKNKQ